MPIRNAPQPPPDVPFDMAAPLDPRLGLRWELKPDPDWSPAQPIERECRTCRRNGCRNRPEWALTRPHRGRPGGVRWLYCSEHLYGRVVVDGVVMCRYAVPDLSREGV